MENIEINTQEIVAENNKEAFTAQEEEMQVSNENDVYIHRFKKPFKCTIKQGKMMEEKTFQTLNFYFGRLTGRDMINIENEMQAMQEYALAPEISRSFQCKMAAKASGISSDVLENMPLNEFNKIANAARGFLLNTGY